MRNGEGQIVEGREVLSEGKQRLTHTTNHPFLVNSIRGGIASIPHTLSWREASCVPGKVSAAACECNLGSRMKQRIMCAR